jgi:hypothetical protein
MRREILLEIINKVNKKVFLGLVFFLFLVILEFKTHGYLIAKSIIYWSFICFLLTAIQYFGVKRHMILKNDYDNLGLLLTFVNVISHGLIIIYLYVVKKLEFLTLFLYILFYYYTFRTDYYCEYGNDYNRQQEGRLKGRSRQQE